MSAFADQNHAPSLTCVRLELIILLEMEIFMLKQQQGYVLSKIGPHTYLLPYGQSIADQKHGIIINETGEFLWKMQPLERFADHASINVLPHSMRLSPDSPHNIPQSCADTKFPLDHFPIGNSDFHSRMFQ